MATPKTFAHAEPSPIPPLEPGDQLTRTEFERRYHAMPDLKKAELIEGVVHMPSPVRWKRHARPHTFLITWLGVYQASTPGVQGGDNGSIRLDLDNEPQPDATLIVEPACGGQVQISADDYIVGGPELLAEVSASTASIDLNAKLRIYRRNNVKEYLVWRVLEQAIDWFLLRDGQYDRLPLNDDGIYKSVVFPGLWLDPVKLADLDLGAVLQILQKGLASAEHAAFVQKLRASTLAG